MNILYKTPGILLAFLLSAAIIADPIPADVLFSDPSLSKVDINPSGSIASFYLTNSDVKQLNLFHLEKRIPTTVIAFSKSDSLKSYRWIDNNNIYITYGNFYTDNVAIVNIDFDREGNESIRTRLPNNGYFLGGLSDKDNRFLYAKKDKQKYTLYSLTLEQLKQGEFTKKSRFKSPLKDALLYAFDSSSNTIFGFIGDKNKEEFSIWRFDKESEQWYQFYLWTDASVDLMPIGVIDNRLAWVLTNELTDKIAIAKFDTQTQTITEVVYEHPEYDLENAEINPSNGELIWVSYFDHGKLVRRYFDDETKLSLAPLVKRFPDKQISTVAASSDKTNRIVIVYSSKDPGTYYLYNTTTQQLKSVGKIYPKMEDFTTSQSEAYKITTKDGNTIEAYLTRPANSDNNTLIVMPHGGPIGVRDFDTFDPTVQYLASRGYTVVRGNFRGSEGYGKAFLESGVGEFGQAIEEDISSIVSNVQSKYNFSKICSMGFSYGGYSAMMLAIENPELYDCVVAMYGIYDLPLLFNESNYKVGNDYRELIERSVGEYKSNLDDVSPVYLADKIQAPVLLVAGRNDETAVIEQSNRMKYQLLKRGKTIDTLFYDRVGHGHDNWKWDQHQMAYVDDFIRKQLKIPPVNSDTARKILAEENGVIADAFNTTNIVDNNIARAFEHYRVAASLGQPRSMFNTGIYYINGRGTKENLPEGLSWLEKSSDNGFTAASYKLATMYLDDINNKSIFDEDKSFKFFARSVEQNHDARSMLYLAHSYCIGAGVQQDTTKCLEYFEKSNKDIKDKEYSKSLKNNINSTYNNVIASILLDPRFPKLGYPSLEKVIHERYNTKWYNGDIKEVSYGMYRRAEGNEGKKNLLESIIIPWKRDHLFGVIFEIDSPEKNKEKTAVVAEWLSKQPDSSAQETRYQSFLFGSGEGNWSMTWRMRSEDLVGTEWTVNIYTTTKELLYSKTFTIVAPD